MDKWIQRLWARKGDVRVLDLNEYLFLVQFAREDDYRHTLSNGPWLVANHYLLVQR